MKITIFAAILSLAAVCLPVLAQPIDSIKSAPERHKKFDPTADAKKDIRDAIILAKESNKCVILDIGGEWCPWCHRLDSLFIQNKDLDDYLNGYYILVKINVSKENKNEEVLSKYPKIEGYPHFFFLNNKGTLIHSQNTEEWEYPKNSQVNGYIKERVLNSLKRWLR
jgi:thioredoxin-related protein